MLFNSLQFVIFFPLVTLGYFLLPHRFRWSFLLAASCLFYMAFVPKYLLILVALIVIDYYAAIWIENSSEPRRKKLFLYLSIFTTCLILFFFKYFNFFSVNVSEIAKFLDWNYSLATLDFILPLGLSFHTFQSLSYVIEVYRGNQKAERHFGIYALYVMFYPQLVAGPIERPQNLIHQFREKHDFDVDRVASGLRLMLWGFIKKLVIADRLAVYVNFVFANPRDFNSATLALAVFFFAYQIYCDFSGYSDIATGAARVMGFKLMLNFNRPYISTSVSEFWNRWHISLSTWVKDYLYTPLTIRFRDYGKVGVVLVLMITFLVIGLWHGAAWTFVVMGGIYGIALSYEALTNQRRKKLLKKYPYYKYFLIAATFVFICFSFIFFRAVSLPDAFYIVYRIVNFTPGWPAQFPVSGFNLIGLSLCFLFIFMLEAVQFIHANESKRKWFYESPVAVRWSAYYGLLLCLLIFGTFTSNYFIYFQF